ncbi:MAG: efflux RND transporter periplasmic adaptor subunit [Myxococcota bacterium]
MARITKVLLPLAIVAAGVGIAGFLVVNAPKPEPTDVALPPKVVETMVAEPGAHRVTVPAMGIVRAEREVTLMPELSGMVVQQSENLVDGGLVRAGDPLIRLDARDLSTQLAVTKSELAQARLAVREETQQKRVAEAEWRDVPKDFSEDSLQYVMRAPHLDAAEARMSSVRSRIKKAKRDLQKTILRAPFDGVVLSESVDLGQVVSPATPIARVAGIDRFWVQVSVPVSQLQFLDVPGINAIGESGSKALLQQSDGSDDSPREGRVLRVLPSVEERGRMAQVLVAVDDPLGLKLEPGQRPTPLLVGTYVQVQLEGRVLEDVVPLPRRALRDDERVFVIGTDGKLATRRIEIAWRERGRVLVKTGLEKGDRVVLTPLPMATDGMVVEVAPETPPE